VHPAGSHVHVFASAHWSVSPALISLGYALIQQKNPEAFWPQGFIYSNVFEMTLKASNVHE